MSSSGSAGGVMPFIVSSPFECERLETEGTCVALGEKG